MLWALIRGCDAIIIILTLSFVQDGLIRLIDLNTDSLSIIEQCNVGFAVNSMGFSPNYGRMVLGSPEVCHRTFLKLGS